MAIVAIISRDMANKNRIMEEMAAKKIECVNIRSAANFDPQEFDVIFVDLDSPLADLVIKNQPLRCIAFGPSGDGSRFKVAKKMGCEKIYGYGEFFKQILPNFHV